LARGWARASLAVLLVAWPLLVFAGHGDQPVVFTQSLTIATATISESQFLAGAGGVPATIGGELRLPVTQARVPVVVLLHGSDGVSPNVRHWSDLLNRIGLGVFVVDSFNGRGIVETSTDQSRLAHAAMLIDAYRALAAVAAHPRVDVRRIAVMGFGKGGWAALYANVRRFHRLHGPKGVEFAAALAFYPPCVTNYLDDAVVNARPLRVLHGTADDWLPIDACRGYTTRLRRAGADAALVELAGARHQFDLQDLPPLLRLPGVQVPSCLTEERAGGVVVNRATGRTPTREDCVQLGASVGYDARAYEEALRWVKETLVVAFGGG
jgi:dienelactone hydrolase